MYTVRVPFTIPTGKGIAGDGASASSNGISLKLKRDEPHNVLEASGFASAEEASAFLARVPAGLALLLLTRDLPVEAALEPQPVAYFPDPVEAGAKLGGSGSPVDAVVDGSRSVVYPSVKRLRFATGLALTTSVQIPAKRVLSALVEGTLFPGSERAATDEKLSLALALYAAYFTEQSPRARFLTLIMSLESLAVPTRKARVALDLLEKWTTELNKAVSNLTPSSEELSSLLALRQELLFRKDNSIRSQIRTVVLSSLAPAEDTELLAGKALELYDVRSRLLHDGTVESGQLDVAATEAKTLVRRVLFVRLDRHLKLTS